MKKPFSIIVFLFFVANVFAQVKPLVKKEGTAPMFTMSLLDYTDRVLEKNCSGII